MTDDELERKQIYIECRLQTGLSANEWARLLYGDEKRISEVYKKEMLDNSPTSRNVTNSEAVAVQLLLFIHRQGVDLRSFRVDEITGIAKPKKPKVRRKIKKKGRSPRKVVYITFHNPHTGQVIKTGSRNNKHLKAWKEEYGGDVVDQWQVK